MIVVWILIAIVGTLIFAWILDKVIEFFSWLYDTVFQPGTNRIDIAARRNLDLKRIKNFFGIK